MLLGQTISEQWVDNQKSICQEFAQYWMTNGPKSLNDKSASKWPTIGHHFINN